MITATKSIDFHMAHMLAGHERDCRFPHGHSYQLDITLRRSIGTLVRTGPAENMVVDFKEIKEFIQTAILDKYDHAFAIWRQSPDPCEQEIRDTLIRFNKKVALLDYRPTAERMVAEMVAELQAEIDKKYRDVVICEAKLWETRTSYATWIL